MKFNRNLIHFQSRKLIWKCRLGNVGHLVSASKCKCLHARRSTIRGDQYVTIPDSKVYGAIMGPIWGWQDPGGPQVGPMNFVIWEWRSERNFHRTGIIHPQDSIYQTDRLHNILRNLEATTSGLCVYKSFWNSTSVWTILPFENLNELCGFTDFDIQSWNLTSFTSAFNS